MLSTELADLKAHMAENPGAVIEDVARQRKVSPRAVLEAMPATMVRIGAAASSPPRWATSRNGAR